MAGGGDGSYAAVASPRIRGAGFVYGELQDSIWEKDEAACGVFGREPVKSP
jgi:hypothetical protein